MSEIRIKSYEELESYLKRFTTWRGDTSVYDVGGAFNLWRALVSNLKAQGLDQEIADYAKTLSDEEIRFLEKIVCDAKSHDGEH